MKKGLRNALITTSALGVVATTATVAVVSLEEPGLKHLNHGFPNQNDTSKDHMEDISEPISRLVPSINLANKYHEEAADISSGFVEYSKTVSNENIHVTALGIIIQKDWTLEQRQDRIAKEVNKYISLIKNAVIESKTYEYIGNVDASNISITDNSFGKDHVFNTLTATEVKITVPPIAGLTIKAETFDLNFTYVLIPKPTTI